MSDAGIGGVTFAEQGPIAIVTFFRPPDNYFDKDLLKGIADALAEIDGRPDLHAVVLSAQGKNFCAGANFAAGGPDVRALYEEGLRIFACTKPIVAAVQGACIGGGLGLALTADFRVVSSRTRFSANFVRLGIHPGFGLTYSLPRLVGDQKAALLMLTGRRVSGEAAVELGLADELVPDEALQERAIALAAEIAEGAPLGVQSTRATLRRGLTQALQTHLDVEVGEQLRLFATQDFKEGVRAMRERRLGEWTAS